MDKKYQIFISSTYEDLKEERQKVCDAVLTLYQIPIGMEMFSAADKKQWEIIKSHIDNTDFYVLIIANRYGSVLKEEGPDKGISYTEKEYNYAVSKGVPVLAFIIDESVPVKPSSVEKRKTGKLKAFKKKVSKGREVVWWKTADDLVAKVSQSLYKQIVNNERPGWVRTNTNDVIETKNEEDARVALPQNTDQINETDKTEKKAEVLFDYFIKELEPICIKEGKIISKNSDTVSNVLREISMCAARYAVYEKEEYLKHGLSQNIDFALKELCKSTLKKVDDIYFECSRDGYHSSDSDRNLLYLNELRERARRIYEIAESYEENNTSQAIQHYMEAHMELRQLASKMAYIGHQIK